LSVKFYSKPNTNQCLIKHQPMLKQLLSAVLFHKIPAHSILIIQPVKFIDWQNNQSLLFGIIYSLSWFCLRKPCGLGAKTQLY